MSTPSLKSISYTNQTLDELLPLNIRRDIQYQSIQNSVGSFHIEIRESEATSCCDFGKKLVILPLSSLEKKVQGVSLQTIESLIFEMVNLSQSASFENLIQKIHEITPDEFVESFERLEHKSALITKAILRRNFSKSYWDNIPIVYCPNKFSLHYLLQQAMGHSKKIWEHYSQSRLLTTEYKGTWSTPISKDEAPIVSSLLHFLSLKDDEPSIGEDEHKYYEKAKDCIFNPQLNDQKELYARLAGRIKEMEKAAEAK